MQITPQSQAIMLLTVSFAKSKSDGLKPLTNSEWGRFAFWLRDHGLTPEALLKGDIDAMLGGLHDRTLTVERVQSLLGRGAALGLSLEKWERAGLWAMTRADPDYPKRLKQKLHGLAPPVLFGCGNKGLLNKRGLAVVGSRDASDEDISFAKEAGRLAATGGLSIISGGARGIDQAAMDGTIASEGTCVGVLADSLMKTATASRYRNALLKGDLVLISPFNPEAGFSVGNAMGRNKYLYCLADGAIVVSSTPNKGGTWSGAIEALKHGWVPVWVKSNPRDGSGNAELAKRGATWLPLQLEHVDALFNAEGASAADSVDDPASEVAANEKDQDVEDKATTAFAEKSDGNGSESSCDDAFLAGLNRIRELLPLTEGEIAEKLDLTKSATRKMLKRAVEGGEILKLRRPVRYQFADTETDQPSFL